MIVKEDFLSKLRRYFGLNLYEVRIWAALLSRGISTAGELSDIADVPRSRSYDILESLEKKGFIVMKIGKPIKYIAVPPEEVVGRVKKNFRKDAEERVKRLDKIKETEILKELNNLHSQGVELIDPTELSGSLRGRNNLYNHLELMIKGASKSVDLVTTAPGLLRKSEGLKHVFESAAKKGVKIRIAAPLKKETASAVKELSKIAEVRNSGKLNARFCIVDGKEIAFMVMNDADVHPSYDVGIWANTPFFASAVQGMFNSQWANMKKK